MPRHASSGECGAGKRRHNLLLVGAREDHAGHRSQALQFFPASEHDLKLFIVREHRARAF